VSFEVAFEGETLVSVYGSRFVKQRGGVHAHVLSQVTWLCKCIKSSQVKGRSPIRKHM